MLKIANHWKELKMNRFVAKLCTMFIISKEKRRKTRRALIKGTLASLNYEKSKLIMVLLCKDEIDIINQWFHFHKAMGVDGFIVTDNGSTDGTREVLEKYKGKGWILEIIDEFEEGYKQDKWCDRMIRLARDKYKADWIISSDADEFWYAMSLNLKKDITSNNGCNLQSVYLKNFVPVEDREDFINVSYFVQRPIEEKARKEYGLENGYGGRTPKVIIKAKDYQMIAMGNHDADMKNRRLCHISNVIVYHYAIRNFSHFVHKVKKGGEALKKNPNLSIGVHWRNWYENYYLTNKMEQAYNKLFRLDIFDKLYEGGIIVKDKSVSEFMKYYTDYK